MIFCYNHVIMYATTAWHHDLSDSQKSDFLHNIRPKKFRMEFPKTFPFLF